MTSRRGQRHENGHDQGDEHDRGDGRGRGDGHDRGDGHGQGDGRDPGGRAHRPEAGRRREDGGGPAHGLPRGGRRTQAERDAITVEIGYALFSAGFAAAVLFGAVAGPAYVFALPSGVRRALVTAGRGWPCWSSAPVW